MTHKEQLLQEIEQAPEALIEELLQFLRTAKANLSPAVSTAETQPFWEAIAEISNEIPLEEWEKLPQDLSKNLDHYLYGSPKEE
jgi:hypothetical protein